MDRSVPRTSGKLALRMGILAPIRWGRHTELPSGLFDPDSTASLSGRRPASLGWNSNTASTALTHTYHKRKLPLLQELVRQRKTILLMRTSSCSSRPADRASRHPLCITYRQEWAGENIGRSLRDQQTGGRVWFRDIRSAALHSYPERPKACLKAQQVGHQWPTFYASPRDLRIQVFALVTAWGRRRYWRLGEVSPRRRRTQRFSGLSGLS